MRHCFGIGVYSLFLSSLFAQTASILNYQGRLHVNGQAFDGQGYFTFAVVDGTGSVLWASATNPLQNTNKLPAEVVPLRVNKGAYSVRLGDPAIGLQPLDLVLLQRAAEPKLRVRFNDGTNGWNQAGEDVPLAAVISAAGDLGKAGVTGLQGAAILRELRELRVLLARQQGSSQTPSIEPNLVTIPLGKGHSLGQATAPLVLLEFTDFQCPYCKRFQETVLPRLVTNYVDSGKLRIVSRNLPL